MNNKELLNFVETIVTLFTIEKGKIKVFLNKKTREPYKGYWELPSSLVKKEETIEENLSNLLEIKTGLKNIGLEQSNVYSELDRHPNNRVIGISYLTLIDEKTVELNNLKEKGEFFLIKELPKLAFDQDKIVKDTIKILKNKLINLNTIKDLFPSDFTLPELHSLYEELLDKKIDRRNFRKKLISLDLIKDTGYMTSGHNGRPAKLYCFKDKIKNINII